MTLLHILSQEIRLLALVVAKNAVGSNWSKQVRTREWKKVPGMSTCARAVVLVPRHPSFARDLCRRGEIIR